MGLHEDGVDLFEINGFGAVTDGFEQGTEAEVFYGAQGTFRSPYDEGSGVFGEGAVRESDTVQRDSIGLAGRAFGVQDFCVCLRLFGKKTRFTSSRERENL